MRIIYDLEEEFARACDQLAWAAKTVDATDLSHLPEKIAQLRTLYLRLSGIALRESGVPLDVWERYKEDRLQEDQ